MAKFVARDEVAFSDDSVAQKVVVVDATGTQVVPTALAATAALQTSGNASLTTIAGTVTSSRAAVNPISGQSGIAAGAGAVGVTVPRITLASDDPAVAALGLIKTYLYNFAGFPAGVERTFSRVVVTQAAAGFFALKALAAGKSPALHALIGTADTADTTLTIQSADADVGTNPVGLSGAIELANSGGVVIPFTADVRGCLIAPAGKTLGFTTATGSFEGYAIVSTD